MTPKCAMKKIKVGKYEKEWLGNSGQLYLKNQGRSPWEGNIWDESWMTKAGSTWMAKYSVGLYLEVQNECPWAHTDINKWLNK